jgi:hypothetical protein
VNELERVRVRPGPVRPGSAVAPSPRSVDEPGPETWDGPATNPVALPGGSAHTRLFDWVPSAEPGATSGRDYPIEAGLPHPRWVPDRAEHSMASSPIVVAESPTVVRLLAALALAAFLLGLTVFYPVSPLGR